MNFPTLYKKTSTGADQFWKIWTENNTIVTEYGQVGGKVQTSRDTISEGKNIGKANETTPVQQAESEAQSHWEKKKKSKGYVESLTAARAGEVDALVEGGINPMLAHRFDEQGHKIVYPAFVQPKLDGHRCIAVVKDGVCTLWSRTRKPITSVPHIIEAVEELGHDNIVLDGELYNHAYKTNFEELTSLIRSAEPKPGHKAVQYHVYDVVNDKPFRERTASLKASRSKYIQVVETYQVESEEDMMDKFDGFVKMGYEGLMVRNAESKYVNKRSYDLQKVKEFLDSEFEVVGVEEGRGKLAGHGIFVCKVNGGLNYFRAKMVGELDNLRDFYENPKKYIGRMLTVKYQGFSNDGIPRFPVAVRFREDV